MVCAAVLSFQNHVMTTVLVLGSIVCVVLIYEEQIVGNMGPWS